MGTVAVFTALLLIVAASVRTLVKQKKSGKGGCGCGCSGCSMSGMCNKK